MNPPLRNLLAAWGNGPAKLTDIPAEWLTAISLEQPSGPSLEYDPEYAVLGSRLAPKTEVQYGQFKASAASPDFQAVERDCRRLLLRSKDIGVLVWFIRSRTRQAGAPGLLQGLSALQQVCERFGETVHPQLHIEGEFDPLVRANALAALSDSEGLLEDLREVVIVAASANRLTVRDVERAVAVPRPAYAPDTESTLRQLADLAKRSDPHLLSLRASAMCVQWLQDWSRDQLGEDAPRLELLQKLLQPFLGCVDQSASQTIKVPAELVESPAVDADSKVPLALELAASVTPQIAWPLMNTQSPSEHNRELVRQTLAQVRAWIEQNEPSSPVSIVLKQAERMWGKRFSEVVHLIPPELLQQWDQDQSAH